MAFFPDLDNRNFDHIGYKSAIKNKMAFAMASICRTYHLDVRFDYISKDYCVDRDGKPISSGHVSMVAAYQWIIENVGSLKGVMK